MLYRIPRLAVMFAAVIVLLTACQPIQPMSDPEPDSAPESSAAPADDVSSDDAKIQSAMDAAPPFIAETAAIVNWPSEPGGEQAVLREGSSGWVCMPDWPATPDYDPMCLDETWAGWMSAFMTGAEPKITTFGVSYMLAGGAAASNTDPFASEPADGEDWVVPPPHVMLLMPGGFDADVYGTDHTSGKPWIMWDETPYEFLIVPTVAAGVATGPIATTDSDEVKIENIMGAAPQVIADGATFMDWPAEAGGDMTLLREGTNEWVCVPDWPATPADDPMCFDPTYMGWMAAFMGGAEPQVDVLGVSYMLAGGAFADITDPSLMEPPAGQDWVLPAPHVMLVAPGGFDAEVFSTDPTSSGSWIVWDETPYEFLVVPIE